MRGHRYLTVVVDHDSGRLVWPHLGGDKATLGSFFDALGASGKGRCAEITHVIADGADWISAVIAGRCPPRCAALSFPHRRLGHRHPRRGPPPGLDRGARSRPPAAREPASGHANR
jgi:Transposase